MGHKVPPLGNRLGITKTWISRWYSKRQGFPKLLVEDDKIRRHLKSGLANAAVSKVEIERTASKVRVIIHSARPGLVIGRRGADIDRLRDELHSLTHRELTIDIKEVKNPAVDAQLTAENIAFQLERQISFRRAMKRSVQTAMNSGALGIRVRCGGRLGGAEMSRVESYRDGKIPLGTFRADIEMGFAEAKTTYGRIGVKCWIYKGDTVLESSASHGTRT
ncbi:MAG: 30S ribosomal protein S3 [Candidatus Omnitrophica bacterium]|nr:30S ribosomal protein S3 [Candidatus Omnitrophota bacterium]